MSKKVLIVDDSHTVRQQVGLALRQTGLFTVVEAADGVEGIAALRKTPDCAMIVTDVNMPNMDGIEMLETIRRDAAFTAIPILVLTTEGQPELIQRAKAAGTKAWMVKPFKADKLVQVVKKLTDTP